jgi:hypothetical protein
VTRGGALIPYATNALDGSRVYFEDDGGDGAPVVLHGGIIDSVDLVRESNIAQALQELPTDEFRLIYVATGDVDFHYQAQQAANEIPNAEFISFEESDHVGAHLAEVDPVLAAVLRTLRASV